MSADFLLKRGEQFGFEHGRLP